MSIWQFHRTVATRLLAWGLFSVFFGALLARSANRFWQGIAGQFIGWGAVDVGLAIFGGISSAKRMREKPEALTPEYMDRETIQLTRLLWVNGILDIVYVLVGLRLAGGKKEHPRGMGWGIVLQGAFLFVFDLLHALSAPPTKRAWRFWDFSHGEAVNKPEPSRLG